jgi:hypothetical protein
MWVLLVLRSLICWLAEEGRQERAQAKTLVSVNSVVKMTLLAQMRYLALLTQRVKSDFAR